MEAPTIRQNNMYKLLGYIPLSRLANHINVQRDTLHNWFAGKSKMPLIYVKPIAEVLHITAADIIDAHTADYEAYHSQKFE